MLGIYTCTSLSDSSRKIIPLCHTSCNNNHSKHRYDDDSLYVCDRHIYIYIRTKKEKKNKKKRKRGRNLYMYEMLAFSMKPRTLWI